jgi:hypothetical protein
LVSIGIEPGSITFGGSNIPVNQDAGLTTQLKALGTYIHPPVVKDITDQVTWASSDTQEVTVNSTGLITATGVVCGPNVLITAETTTNSDGSGVSSSGAVVTGSMTATVTCFTGTGPTVTIDSSGAGAGTVSSSPAGLGCSLSNGSSCSGSFPTGTSVTLTAAATSGTFGNWAGCDSTQGTVCFIDNLTSNVTVTVTFN